MNAHRIRVGIGVGLLGMVMSVGVASAQTLEGSSNSGGGNCCFIESTTTTTKKPAEALPLTETSEPAEVSPVLAFTDDAPASAPASSGTLPFTGGDVAGMVLLGVGALAIGTVMVRRSKAQADTNA